MPDFIIAAPDPAAPLPASPVAAISNALAEDREANAREEAEVTRWQKRIEEDRSFDAAARAQYAKDRRYARGDSASWEVSTNLIGANCDTLTAELYAKDPDVDVILAEQVDAPKETPPQAPPPPPQMAVPDVAMVAAYARLKADHDQSMQAFHQVGIQRRKDADSRKAYCRTVGICISRTWKDARLKRKAKQMVRSALTIGVGWLKVTWQERTGWADPATETRLNDSRARLDRLRALKAQAADGAPTDAELAEIERAHDALLDQNPRQVLARGFAYDFIRAEDVQVSTDCGSLLDYVDAPWIAHRVYMTKTDALAKYPRLAVEVNGEKLIPGATAYEQNKPLDLERQEVGEIVDGEKGITADAADAYRSQSSSAKGSSVCVWEIWDKDAGQMLTLIDGVKRWACDPVTPDPATERFYPFFAYAPIEVDGERHPQSKVSRSYKLQDDYNRTRSRKVEHRRRSLPGILFDEENIERDTMGKIVTSTVGEFTGVKRVNPQVPITESFMPKPVSSIDQALYDTSEIRADMESIWGLQDAITGRVQVAKTATEADIQQQGTQTRSGADRDALEDVLGEIATATAEIMRAKFTKADAQKYAGEFAFWPEGEGADQAFNLLTVTIRAGSSGKPDTAARRQQWAAEAPVIQNAITQIGQLRGADPQEVADCMEAVVQETIERAGDTVEIERFVPQGNAAQQAAAPANTAPPGMGPGVTMAGAPPLPAGIQQAVAAVQPQNDMPPSLPDAAMAQGVGL